MDVAYVEELIDRAEACLREAEGFGEQALAGICRDKITALRLLREQIPPQRGGSDAS